MISSTSTAEVTRGAAEERWFSFNQSTSWHSTVHLIDDILLIYSRGDKRSSRVKMD
jgi:hypothetical protein